MPVLTLKQIIARLPINEQNVLHDVVMQHDLMLHASRYRIKRMRATSEAQANTQALWSEIALTYRSKKDKGGRRAYTEGAIKEYVSANKRMVLMRRREEQCRATEEFAKLLLEVIRSRNRALQLIVDSRLAETGSVAKTTESLIRNAVSKKTRMIQAKSRQVIDEEEEE